MLILYRLGAFELDDLGPWLNLTPFMFSLTVTVYCFLKCLKTLKKFAVRMRVEMRKTVNNIFAYSFAELILLTPLVLNFAMRYLFEIDIPGILRRVSALSISIIGLVNALLCYAQQKSSQSLSKSTIIIEDLNESDSIISNDSLDEM